MMRVANVLRNSTYSVISYALIAILGLAIRKFFTQYLQIELLGLEGLFSNIVSILSLAEMGISTVISYSLYREIANNNQEEINILMSIYRYIYIIIGSIILVSGIVVYFFLPLFIHADNVAWDYIELVYIIQIATVLSSYFLAYKRTLFAADQKDYICIKIDTVCMFMNNITRLVAIVAFQSYFMYAVAGLAFNVLANLIISYKAPQIYPFLKSVKITIQDMKTRKFFIDVKNFLIHKISYVIYSATDAIIVSWILGLRMAGILSNYVLVCNGLYVLLYKALQGITPSIGNLVYAADKEKIYKIYCMLDMAYYFIGAYICCIYIFLFQSFIVLFFGKDFILPDSYVIALAINAFLGMQFENACNFRSTYGVFENDRKYMVFSAVANLIISLVLIHYVGIVGVMIGTIVGLIFILYGRIQLVFRMILKREMKPYLLKHLRWSLFIVVEILIMQYLFSNITINFSYFGLLLECILIAFFMILLQTVVFYKTIEFQDICKYINNIMSIVFQKIKFTK